MPVWFLVLLAVSAAFAVGAFIRSMRSGGMNVGGQRVGRPTILLAATIIAFAFALLAATQLGIIQDHAP